MNDKPDHFILDGKKAIPIDDFMEWAKWYETAKRIVKQTQLPGEVKVSTIFLGLDYGYHTDTPILFETMIFGGEHDQYCNRYSTYEEAEAGHQEAIEMIFEVPFFKL